MEMICALVIIRSASDKLIKKILWSVSFYCLVPILIHAQPIRIDVKAGTLASDPSEIIHLMQSARFTSTSSRRYFEGTIHFLCYSNSFSPFIGIQYNFHSVSPEISPGWDERLRNLHAYTLDGGIGYLLPVGYSKMFLFSGIGYNWDYYGVEKENVGIFDIRDNDMTLLAGLDFYFSFFKNLDATVGYRIQNTKGRTIEGNDLDIAYRLETSSYQHLFSLGISFYFQRENE